MQSLMFVKVIDANTGDEHEAFVDEDTVQGANIDARKVWVFQNALFRAKDDYGTSEHALSINVEDGKVTLDDNPDLEKLVVQYTCEPYRGWSGPTGRFYLQRQCQAIYDALVALSRLSGLNPPLTALPCIAATAMVHKK